MFINKKDPLIIGVDVLEGILKIGTQIYCVEKNQTQLNQLKKNINPLTMLNLKKVYFLYELKL